MRLDTIFGGLLIGVTVVIIALMILFIYRRAKCNIRVIAKLSKIQTNKVLHSPDRYQPVFSYLFDGRTYTGVLGRSMSEKEITKFVLGETYTIYISEKQPHIIQMRKSDYPR